MDRDIILHLKLLLKSENPYTKLHESQISKALQVITTTIPIVLKVNILTRKEITKKIYITNTTKQAVAEIKAWVTDHTTTQLAITESAEISTALRGIQRPANNFKYNFL